MEESQPEKRSKQEQISFINTISNDLLHYIFRMLDAKDLGGLGRVCKRWNMALTNKFWNQLYLQKWGNSIHPQRLEAIEKQDDYKSIGSLEVNWKQVFCDQYFWDNILYQSRVVEMGDAAIALDNMIARALSMKESDDFPFEKFLDQQSFGEDVSLGPVYYTSPENTKKFYNLIKDLIPEDVGKQLKAGDFFLGFECDQRYGKKISQKILSFE
jgi:hypothetical protein